MTRAGGLLIGLIVAALATPAAAGAWNQPKGKGQVILKFEQMTADRGFDPDGMLADLPAERRDASLGAFAEYGLNDRLTVEFKGDLYTILVDQIGEVRLLNRTDFEASPATLDPKLKQLCTGIYRLDGELLAVLDVNQILSPETIAQTPPIQFIARRPKESTNMQAVAQK